MKVLFIFWVCSNQIFKQFAEVCDFLTQFTVRCRIRTYTNVPPVSALRLHVWCMVCRQIYEYLKNHLKLVQHQLANQPIKSDFVCVYVCGLRVYLYIFNWCQNQVSCDCTALELSVLFIRFEFYISHFIVDVQVINVDTLLISNQRSRMGGWQMEKRAIVCLLCTHKY